MNIEEYADELRLIKKQYGQEEDLYFIINKLIRERLPENTVLRDIHRAQNTDNKIFPARENFNKYGQIPDFIILDSKFDQLKDKDSQKKYVYGCVEVKKLIEGKNTINKEVGKITEEFLGKADGKIKKAEYLIKEYFNEGIMIKICKKEFTIKKEITIIESKTKEKSKTKVTYQIIIKNKIINKNFAELLKEIAGFKRVIYTNGLEWVYFECENQNEKIKNTNKKEIEIIVKVWKICELSEKIVEGEISEKDRKSFEKLGEKLEMIFKNLDKSG